MNRNGFVQFYASDYENNFPKMNLVKHSTHTFRMKMNHMPFQNCFMDDHTVFNRQNESQPTLTIRWMANCKFNDDPLCSVTSSILKNFHYDLKRCSTPRAIPSWSTLA